MTNHKSIIAIIYCIALSAPMWAEEYMPFIKMGRRWECAIENSLGLPERTFTVTVERDTFMEGNNCWELLLTYNDTGETEKHYVWDNNGSLQLIQHWLEFPTYISLLDVSVKAGDRVCKYKNGKQSYSLVNNTGYTTINNTRRKYVYIHDFIGEDPNGGLLSTHRYWIEGIGSAKRSLFLVYFEPTPEYVDSYLVACYDGDECIFRKEDFPGYSAISDITSDSDQHSPLIYDIYGRPVVNPLPGSLYIINGHKTIWK